MYRISYEKCVCFIFLVILAILSCSGVRIDNLAMTDINKRNSHTSSSSLLNSDNRLFFINTTTPTFRHHRIRHHRQLRAQAHTTRPTPFNEPFAQIPSTDVTQVPTKSHVQRSTKNNKQKKKRKQKCPDYDITWKFCQANTVVQARYESKSSSCKQNCTMLFKVIRTLKPSKFPIDDRIPINLPMKKEKSTCDYDDLVNRSKFLVRTEINQSTEYILFLDAYGAHNFSAVFAPEPIKNRTPINKLIKLKCHQKERFLGKIPRNQTLNTKRLRFVCKVKGRPIPIIYWEKNGVLIQPSNSHIRITNKKRKSSLVIRKPTEADSGRYECVARGLDGNLERQHFDYNVRPCNPDLKSKCPGGGTCLIRINQMEEFCVCPGGGEKCRKGELSSPSLSSRRCRPPINESYCLNGGTCFDATGSEEFSCVCPVGYGGARCDTKELNTSSMYRQTPKYTCSEGIYTKYDNCH